MSGFLAETSLPSPESPQTLLGRILVVDDEPSIRRLLSFNLCRLGYSVEVTETGEAALERLTARDFDLVLLDLMLPGISGLEVLRRVRNEGAEIPIILLTAHGKIDDAVEAMKLGAHDFLTKPFEMDRLSIIMRNALRLGELAREVKDLRQRLSAGNRIDEIVGRDGGLRGTMRLVEKALPTDLTVLLEGESGTGKELVARALHFEGPRREQPFVAINCANLPEALLESELFGHERGAFTGADRSRPGKLELGGRGTVFLDEISETSPAVQAKLLRVLQERQFLRLGGSEPMRLDARLICATNRDLEQACSEGRFRRDLYFRIAVFPIRIPPLRQRREDIPSLVNHLLARTSKDQPRHCDPAALELLEGFDWPGNVRELHNVLRRALALAAGQDAIRPEHLPSALRVGGRNDRRPVPLPTPAATLEEVEQRHIESTVAACRGNLSEAARRLGIGRSTLYRKLERIARPGE